MANNQYAENEELEEPKAVDIPYPEDSNDVAELDNKLNNKLEDIVHLEPLTQLGDHNYEDIMACPEIYPHAIEFVYEDMLMSPKLFPHLMEDEYEYTIEYPKLFTHSV